MEKNLCYSFLIQTLVSSAYRAHLFLFPPWFKQTHPQVFLKSFKLLVQFKKIFPSTFFSPSHQCKEEFFRPPTAVPRRVTESAHAPFYIFLLADSNVSLFSLAAVVNSNARLPTQGWGVVLATDLITPMTLRSVCYVSLPLARG